MTFKFTRKFLIITGLIFYGLLPGLGQVITTIESTANNEIKVKIEGLVSRNPYTLFYWDSNQPLAKTAVPFTANSNDYEHVFNKLTPDQNAYSFQATSSFGDVSNTLGSIRLTTSLGPIHNILTFDGPETANPSITPTPIPYDVTVYENTINNIFSEPQAHPQNPFIYPPGVTGLALQCRNFIYRAQVEDVFVINGAAYPIKIVSNYALADRKGQLSKKNMYFLSVTYDLLRPNQYIQVQNQDISSAAGLKHKFYVSSNNSDYALIDSVQSRNINFKVPDSNVQYCFKFEKELSNGCNTYSDLSPASCSMLLKLERGSIARSTPDYLNENKNTYNSNDYTFYFSNGVLRPIISSLLPVQDFSGYIPDFATTGYFDIWASSNGDYYTGTSGNPKAGTIFGFMSFSNRIRYYLEQEMYIPTAFSREGASRNSRNLSFKINLKYPDLPIKGGYIIIDRWGNPVYQTNKIETAWDGTLDDGSIISPGHYVVKAYGSTMGGTFIEKTGTLTIF